MGRYVVGISGASGIILGYKTASALAAIGHHVELCITSSALFAAKLEMGSSFSTGKKFVDAMPSEIRKNVTLHPIHDIGATIASGSFSTEGMAIVPCSMATIAALSWGLADNLVRRAADVTLKEKRPLILVPRETPFSAIHLENLLRLAKCGATILPPVPAWYTFPQNMEEIENFIVGKVLDAFKLPHDLYPKWEGSRHTKM